MNCSFPSIGNILEPILKTEDIDEKYLSVIDNYTLSKYETVRTDILSIIKQKISIILVIMIITLPLILMLLISQILKE